MREMLDFVDESSCTPLAFKRWCLRMTRIPRINSTKAVLFIVNNKYEKLVTIMMIWKKFWEN